MPSIGKETFFVKLLHLKTKIKPEDIVDLLKAIPECMAEAFLEANPAQKQAVHFGVNKAHWKLTPFGPTVAFSPTKAFKERMVRLKVEKKYPLAAELYDLMMPITHKRIAEKAKNGGYEENYVPPTYTRKSAETPTEKAENRRILREKRKKQAIMLKNSIT